jgi:hypothetical protein|tara:strand:+ start:396 stop:563 length:168 start_codon:yes stop_codon:yes gene_type:complete
MKSFCYAIALYLSVSALFGALMVEHPGFLWVLFFLLALLAITVFLAGYTIKRKRG